MQHSTTVQVILRACDPLKVLDSVVVADAVLVVDLGLLFGVWYKGQPDEYVDALPHSFAIVTEERGDHVTVARFEGLVRPSGAYYVPAVADQVPLVEAWDDPPLFGVR